MARDKLTPLQLTTDSGVDAKAATVMTTITAANGAYIDVSNINTDKLIIHVKNTNAGAKTLTVKAGIYSRSSLGDLVVSVALTSGEKMIVCESSRFKDSDNFILLDYEAAMTGLIGAYLLP